MQTLKYSLLVLLTVIIHSFTYAQNQWFTNTPVKVGKSYSTVSGPPSKSIFHHAIDVPTIRNVHDIIALADGMIISYSNPQQDATFNFTVSYPSLNISVQYAHCGKSPNGVEINQNSLGNSVSFGQILVPCL